VVAYFELLPHEYSYQEMTMENSRTALKLVWIMLAAIVLGASAAIAMRFVSN